MKVLVLWTRDTLVREGYVSNSYQERNERESWDRPDRPLERAFRCGSHVGSAYICFEMRETS